MSIELLTSRDFTIAIQALESNDIYSCNLRELFHVVQDNLGLDMSLSKEAWGKFIYDQSPAEVKVSPNYVKSRQAFAMKLIQARKELVESVLGRDMTKQRGAIALLGLRFKDYGIDTEAEGSMKIPSGPSIMILPSPPPALGAPPSQEDAAKQAESYTEYELIERERNKK